MPNYVIDIASVQNQGLLGLLPQLLVNFCSWLVLCSLVSTVWNDINVSFFKSCFSNQLSLALLISYVLGAIVDWWWLSFAWLLVQVSVSK